MRDTYFEAVGGGLLQLVLEGKVEGRKGRGRPRRKWGGGGGVKQRYGQE